MAEQKFEAFCGFFDAINHDRTYSADEMNRPYKRIITNGVFATPQGTPSTDLQVKAAGSGMNIIVKKGEGLFGDKWFENQTDLPITVSTNNAIVPRIDSVIVQVDKSQSGRTGSIILREGTPSSNPQAPQINTNSNKVEYRVANILVEAAVSEITQSAITDLRGSAECPWVTSLIKQVDTSALYAQWQDAYSRYFEQSQDDVDAYTANRKQMFDDFLASLTQDLTVATNLVKYESHYTTITNGQTQIPINIATFNKEVDILMVRVNKLFASEGVDYTISNDGTTITLTKDLLAGQEIDFLVLKSVVVGNVETVEQEVNQLLALINKTKITADNGSLKITLSSNTDNALEAFVNAGIGFHTLYAANGVQGLPKAGAFRIFGHMTNADIGYVFAMQADGSVYSNYLHSGTWRGWKTLYEATPGLLYQSVNGVFPNNGLEIVPSKPLNECAHGWVLIFTGYDDDNHEGRDYYVQSVTIPKRCYSGERWNGESMTFPLVYSYNSGTDANLQCTKTFKIYNDRIVSGTINSNGVSRNMVLRSIHEY